MNVCEKELAQQQEVLAEKEHTITALESMVSRKNDHLATLQEEKEGLAKKMAEKTAELEDARHTQAEAVVQQEKDWAAMQDKMQAKMQAKMQDKMNVMESNLVGATKGIEARDAKITELQLECDEMFEEIEKKEQVLDKCTTTIKQHDTTIAQHVKALKEQQGHCKAMEKKHNVALAALAQEQGSGEALLALETELKDAKERIQYLDTHKLTEVHITKFTKIAEGNQKLKSMNLKLKNKCVELHKKLEALVAENNGSSSSGSGSNEGQTLSSRDAKKFEKLKTQYKDIKNKLQEYYNKVKTCEKERKKMMAMMKKVPDMKENTKKSTSCLEYVEKLIEFHTELREFSAEENKTIEMMEARVNSLQKKRNEDLLLMEKGCTTNERKFAALNAEKESISTELNAVSDECNGLKVKLEKEKATMKRTNGQHAQRINYLEKENLNLMLQQKKLEKTIKTQKKKHSGAVVETKPPTRTSARASTRRSSRKSSQAKNKNEPEIVDKENMVVVEEEDATMSKKKKNKNAASVSQQESEDTMLLNELMLDAGISDGDMDDDDDEEYVFCCCAKGCFVCVCWISPLLNVSLILFFLCSFSDLNVQHNKLL